MRKNMRKPVTAILTLVLATFVIGCGGGEKGTAPDNDSITRADSMALKVGVLPTLDCLPLYVAEEKGIFDSIGVDVRLKYFDNSFDSDMAIMEGTIEGGVTDCVRAAWMAVKSCAVTPVCATNAYWQLVTNKKARLSRLSEMTDKMIAMTRFSATAMLADMAVDSSKIDKDYVFLIQINNPNTRLMMIQNNEMDAAMMAEPHASAARADGHRVLMDSREKGLQLGAIVFSDATLSDERRRAQAEKFIRAYDIAVEEINKHGAKHFSDIIKQRMGVSDKVVAAIPDVKFDKASAPRTTDIDRAKEWIDRQNVKQGLEHR